MSLFCPLPARFAEITLELRCLKMFTLSNSMSECFTTFYTFIRIYLSSLTLSTLSSLNFSSFRAKFAML